MMRRKSTKKGGGMSKLDKTLKILKNTAIVLTTIASALTSLEKLSQLDLKADNIKKKD